MASNSFFPTEAQIVGVFFNGEIENLLMWIESNEDVAKMTDILYEGANILHTMVHYLRNAELVSPFLKTLLKIIDRETLQLLLNGLDRAGKTSLQVAEDYVHYYKTVNPRVDSMCHFQKIAESLRLAAELQPFFPTTDNLVAAFYRGEINKILKWIESNPMVAVMIHILYEDANIIHCMVDNVVDSESVLPFLQGLLKLTGPEVFTHLLNQSDEFGQTPLQVAKAYADDYGSHSDIFTKCGHFQKIVKSITLAMEPSFGSVQVTV